ncbi:hypothetical protein GCM10009784_15760 [Arthrobacter parietis]|uniref:DUF4232 domain-containing protein n=1 Tax=Arthrobacter parietis TaxID=271434 RepID=A0ABN3AVF6_9MICC
MTTRVPASCLLAAAVALGTLALTGCASGEPAAEETGPASSASEEPTTAEEPTPSQSTSKSASAEPSESSEPTQSATADASPTASPADGVCTADMLSAVLETEMGGGAAGSVYRQIIFTNTASEECEITGYPGMSYVDAAGNQVGAPADREPAESAEVILAPGESAVAPVKQTNAQNYGADCELTDVAGLRVYPPNDTESLIVDQTGTACAAEDIVLMTVAPTKPLSP